MILYRGPSLLDGKPIVAIANGWASTRPNRKTGPAIQTYVFRSDVSPMEAASSGEDSSVCGDCPLRPITSGVCYVEIGKGVRWTWEEYERGHYGDWNPEFLLRIMGWLVRIGTYGDPAAVPFEIWRDIASHAGNHTGYTHQWRTCDQRFRSICMASVDSEREGQQALAMGWRTFRLRRPDESLASGEIVCPSSAEGLYRRQCSECRACRGAGHGQSSVAIVVHGRPWKAAQLGRLKNGQTDLQGLPSKKRPTLARM